MYTCQNCNETWTTINNGLLPGFHERHNIKTEAWYPTDEKPLEEQEDCPACEKGVHWEFRNV